MTLLLGKCHKPKTAVFSPKAVPKIKLKLGKNASVGFRRLQWYRLDKFKVLGFEK
jgi:hypothetical protein